MEEYPECVRFDENSGYYRVDYIKVVPILLQGIKEQGLKIKSLEDDIEEIKQKLQ